MQWYHRDHASLRCLQQLQLILSVKHRQGVRFREVITRRRPCSSSSYRRHHRRRDRRLWIGEPSVESSSPRGPTRSLSGRVRQARHRPAKIS